MFYRFYCLFTPLDTFQHHNEVLIFHLLGDERLNVCLFRSAHGAHMTSEQHLGASMDVRSFEKKLVY
jgi:hypothetical protein